MLRRCYPLMGAFSIASMNIRTTKYIHHSPNARVNEKEQNKMVSCTFMITSTTWQRPPMKFAEACAWSFAHIFAVIAILHDYSRIHTRNTEATEKKKLFELHLHCNCNWSSVFFGFVYFSISSQIKWEIFEILRKRNRKCLQQFVNRWWRCPV